MIGRRKQRTGRRARLKDRHAAGRKVLSAHGFVRHARRYAACRTATKSRVVACDAACRVRLGSLRYVTGRSDEETSPRVLRLSDGNSASKADGAQQSLCKIVAYASKGTEHRRYSQPLKRTPTPTTGTAAACRDTESRRPSTSPLTWSVSGRGQPSSDIESPRLQTYDAVANRLMSFTKASVGHKPPATPAAKISGKPPFRIPQVDLASARPRRGTSGAFARFFPLRRPAN